jgi:hypothetical protein
MDERITKDLFFLIGRGNQSQGASSSALNEKTAS